MNTPQLFDRRLLKQQRLRSQLTPRVEAFYQHIGNQLRQRLAFFPGFERGLTIGPFSFPIATTTFRADCVATADTAVVMDEEWFPFARASLDIIVSFMGLHVVNDLAGALSQFKQALRPKGLFLAAFVGEESLMELRQCFYEVELQQNQGVSPRIMPLLTLQDAGSLLQRAHFTHPVVDKDRLTLNFPCFGALITFLRAAGLTNVLQNRDKRPLSRSLLSAVKKLYQQQYPSPLTGIRATFDILYMAGVSEGSDKLAYLAQEKIRVDQEYR